MAERTDPGVNRQLDELKPDLIKLSEYLYANPELGHQEHKACAAHTDMLRKNGFTVMENYLGLATAFRAEYDSGRPGPTAAYLAEYDALPEIGHGCGHNLLGTTSTGAGIILSRLMGRQGGKAIVIGTPAEETDGAKAHLVAQGAFADIDVALIAHPSQDHRKSGASQAMESLEFTFHGKTAHAAASPEEGINALDGVLNLFSGVNALREHTRTDARIHGIITEGGKAPNIVPDLAKAHFYVRAADKKYLTELVERGQKLRPGGLPGCGDDPGDAQQRNILRQSDHQSGFISNLRQAPDRHGRDRDQRTEAVGRDRRTRATFPTFARRSIQISPSAGPNWSDTRSSSPRRRPRTTPMTR